jgi:hypothetical protein
MLPSTVSPPAAIFEAMDLTSRVLIVLGFVAGAVTGAMVVAALLLAVDVPTQVAAVLMAAGAAAGAPFGARVNHASARLLTIERDA